MRILIYEYSVANRVDELIPEGAAMLSTLYRSFRAMNHDVVICELGCGDEWIEKNAGNCDAGIAIAPDHVLQKYLELLEEQTINLGCTPASARICSDKLETTKILERHSIPVPKIGKLRNGKCVIKPRWGCGCEGVRISSTIPQDDRVIGCEFISGINLSTSVIAGRDRFLPLTVNEQKIVIEDGRMMYVGGNVPFRCEEKTARLMFELSNKVCEALGCGGYIGIDFVLSEKPYVVDVNPRPTTSIVGVSRVIDWEISDLILRSKFGNLPDRVSVNGSFSFTKSTLSDLSRDILG